MQPLPTASAGVGGLMERDLLSRVTGDSGRHRLQGQGQGQDQDPRPPPSPTLSLRVGTERQSRAADDANRGHGHEPQQAQAAAGNVAALLPSSSRLPFAPDGHLASVVVPGYPMFERRHNLRTAGAGAPAQAAARTMPVHEQRALPAGLAPAPQRPPTATPSPTAPVRCTLELAVAGPTVTTGPRQERCDACGINARLLQGLSSDLDRARAQVALLTCQNESLRHRLKRASASASASASAAAGPECSAASAGHLSLRCGACRARPATVQLVPREHLCLCGHCSNSSRVACPVCRAAVAPPLADEGPQSHRGPCPFSSNF